MHWVDSIEYTDITHGSLNHESGTHFLPLVIMENAFLIRSAKKNNLCSHKA